jgi:hypothetical protein
MELQGENLKHAARGSVMDEFPAKSSSHRIGWIVGGTAGGIALLALTFWFLMGQKIWTDGGAIRVADRDATLRQVVWTKPIPLEGLSSEEQVYEPSTSPDGTELYFVCGKAGNAARIFVSQRRNNEWTKPVAVEAVNGPFDSLGPRVSSDGRFLLFYSNRPGGLGGYDIWAAPRTGSGWGKPFNLGPSVNTEFNEFNPDPTPDGKHLVFATNRKDAKRQQSEAWRSTIRETVSSNYDLWIADADIAMLHAPAPTTSPATQPIEEPSSLAFHAAREIPVINTPSSEGASCMSPAGDFLYFASDRAGGRGKFDIYRCRVHGDEFGSVENLGPSINTSENEADPALAYNGFRLIFSSDRLGADGRYHLLASDSREVYPERQAHPLPHLGWSWWLLIGSVIVLVPLLMFLRGWEDHRLGVIQKCLLLSLLFHALITFVLSFVAVTQKITQYVRQESHVEVAVQLSQDQGVEESLAIRGQVSGSVPVSDAPAASLQPARIETSAIAEALPAQLDVAPGVRVPSGGMTIPVQALQPKAAPAQSARAEVATATPNTDLVDVKLPAMRAVAEAEAMPKANIALPDLDKSVGSNMILPGTAEVSSAAVPSAAPSSMPNASLTVATQARPLTPSEAPVATSTAPESIERGVVVEGPRPADFKVTAAEQIARPTVQTGAQDIARTENSSPAASSGMALLIGIPKSAELGSTLQTADVPAHAALEHARESFPVPQLALPAGSMAAPEVHVAINDNTARQSSTEALLTLGSEGEAARPTPPPGSQNGMPSAGPGQVAVSAAPVKLAAGPTDLPVAMASSGVHSPGRAGTEIGSGPAPSASPDITPAGAEVALPGGVSGKATSAEPALATSGVIQGPTSRPVEVAVAHGSVERVELSGPAAGAGVAHTPSQIDVGIVRGSNASKSLAVATIQPEVNAVGDSMAGPPLASPKIGAKLTEKSGGIAPTQEGGAVALLPSDKLSTSAHEHGAADSGKMPGAAAPNRSPAADLASAPHIGPKQATGSRNGPTVATVAAGEIAAPDVHGPAMTGAGGANTPIVGGTERKIGANAVAGMAAPAKTFTQSGSPIGIDISSAPVLATAQVLRRGVKDPGPSQPQPRRTEIASASAIIPDISLAPLDGAFGPGKLTAPDSPFMRGAEQRRPLLEKLGGTQESEDAVALGLAYLARMQEDDGRWTRVDGERGRARRAKSHHDMACTGFALLAFLGQDHRPDKPGPYRDVVAHAVEYLISQQDEEGDLRGPRELRGGGSDSGNMYDHGVAAYALAECGIMTHDPRVIEGASKAARFIVAAQDPGTGGWRYSPKEPGDSSVFGWQVMALHSAEQIGFQIPPETLDGAKRYLTSCEAGHYHLLSGYQPHSDATPPMTAELLFSRMLLDLPLSDEGMQEVTAFLSREPPEPRNADVYYWYYASLSMLNMQNPRWKDWNVRTRESLIKMQRKEGPYAGCWDTNVRWADRGGRIFTTAMATLTLEVYYRYLPLRKHGLAEEAPASN